jgi:hypothetical protein
LIDLPYLTHPQAAKQAAKIWHFVLKKRSEKPVHPEQLFDFCETRE